MPQIYTIILDGEEHQLEIEPLDQGYELKMGGVTHRFLPLLQEPPLYSFLIDETHILEADVLFQQGQCELNVRNLPYHLEIFDPRRRVISQTEGGTGGGLIQAPMPGKVIEVKVKPQEKVTVGQAVVIIEAMKMQNELSTPIDGVVQEICVKPGDTVEANARLVVVIKTP